MFRFTEEHSQLFIKRIVGLPEETIKIKDNHVLISNQDDPTGFVLDESYLTEQTPGKLEVKLDENDYFVLGDNRDESSDSRRWGPLPRHLIIGKVWLRAWPVKTAQAIDTPVY